MPPLSRLAPLTLAALLMIAVPARATTMVKRLSLGQVTKEAAHIVHGTVTQVRSDRDESGVPATWVTVSVSRTLKGRDEKVVTFKQAGVAEPLPDGTITRIAGMPRYTVGEEVVLFLRGQSGRGFTSPVGLQQGTFRVDRKPNHAEVKSDLGEGGNVELDQFLSTVSNLAAAPE